MNKTTMITVSVFVGIGFALVFFFAFFFVAASIGGVLGTASLLSHLYAAMLEFPVKLMRIPKEGSLFTVTAFWGIAASTLTFLALVSATYVCQKRSSVDSTTRI